MIKRGEKKETKADISLFTITAWFTFLVPIATTAIAFLIASSDDRIGQILHTVSYVLLGNLLLGLGSLLIVPSDAGKPLKWLTWVGILASIVLGFLAFVLAGLLSNSMH